jgi:Zn-dependent protease with chaperone function
MSTAILEVLNSGITCITTNDEAINIFGPAFAIKYKSRIGALLDFPIEILNQLKEGQLIIIIQKGLKEYLTVEEYNSILAHEQAHILLGHLDTTSPVNDYNQQNELDADDYAIEIFGKDACVSSLEKIEQFHRLQPAYLTIRNKLKDKVSILNTMRFNFRLKRIKNLK